MPHDPHRPPLSATRIGNKPPATVNQFLDYQGSAGYVSGGAVTDAGGGTIDVAAGVGFFRTSDSRTAPIRLLNWPAVTGQTITTDTIRYVGVEYNSGFPQVVIKTGDTWDENTDWPLADIANEGDVLHIDIHRNYANDIPQRLVHYLEEVFHIQRADAVGGLILADAGVNNVVVSAGEVYNKLHEFDISAIDTSGADTFDRYYKDGGGGWTVEAGESTWPNTEYDDGDGGLATLTNNWWSAVYFYIETDGGLVMLYGQAQYATEAMAEVDTPSATVPDRLATHGLLIGRMIFQKSAATATVQSVFTVSFQAASASGDVAGPVSATDNAFARFDGATGKLIQDSANGPLGADDGSMDIVGSADVIQLQITANATQTADIVRIENSAAFPLLLLDVNGDLAVLGTFGGNVVQSVVATGTAPLIVASTTVCTNLNADLLDGSHAAAFAAAAHTIASHSDTTATGTELETLTDGSNADALHVHTGQLKRVNMINAQTVPDSSGDVFFEPYSIKATNDLFKQLVLIFNNSGSIDEVSGVINVPQDYAGTLAKIVVDWTSTATSGDVEFEAAYRAVGGNDTGSLDQATYQEDLTTGLNDTAPSAAHERMEFKITLTHGNISAGDTLPFVFRRDSSDAGDTLGAAVIIHGLHFEYEN